MKRSILIAVVLALAAVGWVASGQFDGRKRPVHSDGTPATTAIGEDAPGIQSVRVRRISARPRGRLIIVNGRTEASRTVQLRAEVAGRVTALGAPEGAAVRRGDMIAKLSTEDREARLAEAKALLRQRDIEYQAARKLFKKGFRADTKLAEAKANLDSAKAQVERTRIDLVRTSIDAPFDGFLDRRPVVLGAYLQVGDAIGTIVDLDPVLVVGHVSERDIGAVTIGAWGEARLSTGARVKGTIRYVAAVADSLTRTFRVELEIANPRGEIRDGLTSELRIPMAQVWAHRVTPALLTLDSDGRIGVKILGAGNRVAFNPVEIVEDTQLGVWVTGLPERVVVISVGHEFVRAGDRVNPVFESDGAAG